GPSLCLSLTQVTRGPRAGRASIELSLVDPTGQTLPLAGRQAAGKEGVAELGEVVTREVYQPGRYEVRARLAIEDKTVYETGQPILVLPPSTELASQVARCTWLGEKPAWLAGSLSQPGADDAAGALLMVARPGSLRESEWNELLEQVQAGRTAIIGPLHKRDTLAVDSLGRHGLAVQLSLGIGNWMGCYHWAP